MSSHDSGSSQKLSGPKDEPPPKSTDHGAMLFVSLLENFVRTNPVTAHMGEEMKQAAYDSIMRDLIQGGVVPTPLSEFTKQNQSKNRAQYQKTLNNLLERKVQVANQGGIVVEDDRGLVIDRDNIRVLPSLFETNVFAATPIPHLIPGTTIPLNSGAATRYSKDYQQLEFLGKGGYGTVWSCRHALDGQLYAVKQIYLNKALEPITRGKSKADEDKVHNKIFKEIRTLASLDHCNVVRYYSSWLEAMPLLEFKKQNKREDATFETDIDESESLATTAQDVVDKGGSMGISSTAEQFTRIQTLEDNDGLEYKDKGHDHEEGDDSNDGDDEDEYEYEEDGKNARESRSNIIIEFGDSSGDIVDHRGATLSDKQTNTPTNDDQIQMPQDQALARRYPGQDSHPADQTIALPEKQFAYILYLQMSLHPISLAQYIDPPSGKDQTGHIRHTFHPRTSVNLILKIIDGVEYLHKSKLLHRDLKPANIFLTIEEEDCGSPGGVQMGGCHCSGLENKLCDSTDTTKRSCLDNVKRWVVPKIGDFGLVTDLSMSDGTELPHDSPICPPKGGVYLYEVVGTMFYRPPIPNDSHDPDSADSLISQVGMNAGPTKPPKIRRHHEACEKTDVYALGIILFELLYRMNSAFERSEVLKMFTNRSTYELTGDCYPPKFPTFRYGDKNEKLIDVVIKMTNINSANRCTLSEARSMLQSLLE